MFVYAQRSLLACDDRCDKHNLNDSRSNCARLYGYNGRMNVKLPIGTEQITMND